MTTVLKLKERNLAYLYCDESGDLRTSENFYLGILWTSEPRQLSQSLGKARSARRCTREVKFSKTDKLVLPLCLDFLDIFWNDLATGFSTIKLARAGFKVGYYRDDRHPDVPGWERAYNVLYRKHLLYTVQKEVRIIDPNRILVRLDEKSTTRDNNFLTYLKREIPQISSVYTRSSKTCDLIQLADLILGCVAADSERRQYAVGSPLQAKVNHLKTLLGTRRLIHRPSSRAHKWHVHTMQLGDEGR